MTATTYRGRLFTITHNPGGTTTEACRDCGWDFTYRGRPTPTQRGDKAAHICPDMDHEISLHANALAKPKESL